VSIHEVIKVFTDPVLAERLEPEETGQITDTNWIERDDENPPMSEEQRKESERAFLKLVEAIKTDLKAQGERARGDLKSQLRGKNGSSVRLSPMQARHGA
jgi:hypothetical protein